MVLAAYNDEHGKDYVKDEEELVGGATEIKHAQNQHGAS
jgi:hypothetical protein